MAKKTTSLQRVAAGIVTALTGMLLARGVSDLKTFPRNLHVVLVGMNP